MKRVQVLQTIAQPLAVRNSASAHRTRSPKDLAQLPRALQLRVWEAQRARISVLKMDLDGFRTGFRGVRAVSASPGL